MSRERTTARTKWRQNCSYLWILSRSQQPQTPFTKVPLIVQGMTNSGNSNNTMSAPQHGEGVTNKKYVESMMNLALLDPPRWGWPALGPVVDLLTPHEVSLLKFPGTECRRILRNQLYFILIIFSLLFLAFTSVLISFYYITHSA